MALIKGVRLIAPKEWAHHYFQIVSRFYGISRKLFRGNDDGSSGVNLEYHVHLNFSSCGQSLIIRVTVKKHIFSPTLVRNEKSGTSVFPIFIVSWHGITRTQESRRIRNGHDSEAA